jgi:branched-chain amino acid transport system substrate-binding protein
MVTVRRTLSRRALLNRAAAVAAGGALSGLALDPARPAGASPAPARGEPILIGHQCELTGWDAADGYWRNKTATKAVEWLNNNGGIAGRPVRLVTVDTKSDVDAGVTRLRELLQEDHVDFVIGAELTSIALASNKLADQFKTVYMTLSTSAETTGEGHAVRYQFRMATNSHAEALGAAKYMVDHVGRRWTVLYADYAWGQSERDWWTRGVAAAGGEVVRPVGVPLDAQDLIPYVARIDRSTEGIYIPVLNALQTIQTIRGAGLKQEIVLAGDSFSLFDLKDLGKSGEGVWGIEMAPLELRDMDTPYMRTVYKVVGIDDNGREIGTGKAAGASMVLEVWETLGFLKINIERSGWKSRNDTLQLIEQAEAKPTYPQGTWFPLGSVFVRPADHQSFMDLYIVRVENGRLRKKGTIPRAQTMYAPDVNLAGK